MVIEADVEKYKYPVQRNEKFEEGSWDIVSDHCYARPWNWKSESNFLRPTKTLFISKENKSFLTPLGKADDANQNIDVETVEKDMILEYDVHKARTLMNECEEHLTLFKTHDNVNWEENIQKLNWTATQMRLFNGIVNILNQHRLGKLAYKEVNYEAICSRTLIDKSVKRVRLLFSTIFWEPKLTHWLHQLLMDNLSMDYLICYIDILQTLKAKLPQFVEKMIYSQTIFRHGSITTDNLQPILKRPWDPSPDPNVAQDKLKKLPTDPIIVMVPSCSMSQKRLVKWIDLFSNLATVINIPIGFGLSGQKLTMTQCADQMYSIVKSKMQEIRTKYPGRNLVLVGFNAGASLALQIAQTEPIVCVVSIGFAMRTAEGRRGEPDDALMELQCPVLFVVGQRSTVASKEDMEDLRERMRVETGLVVVGAADNNLRINKKKKREEGITQSMLDRCIVEEVGEFVSGIILSPFPPQIRQSPTQVPIESPSLKKQKLERRRYNSTASSLDSEDLVPARIPRPVGRPPGSKSKPRLEAKWAAQVQQGISSSSLQLPESSNTTPSPPLTPVDTSSNDSFPSHNVDTGSRSLPPSPVLSRALKDKNPPRPRKKIKTLLPVHKQRVDNASSASDEKFSLATTDLGNDSIQSPFKSNSANSSPAKLQAYGMTKHNIISGSRLSTLLQGGIKTIPPSAPKPPSTTKIRVLENITLQPSPKYPTGAGRPVDMSKITVLNSSSSLKSTSGNVVILPDGKIKTIGHGNIYKGVSGRYITSKKQLMANKRPPIVKKPQLPPPPPYPSTQQSMVPSVVTLPPPTNLTSQDIMDLPIIFADDNSSLLDSAVSELTPSEKSIKISPIKPSMQKILTSTAAGNKYVVINKPQVSQQTATNFVISTSGSSSNIKKFHQPTSTIYKQPKYTKIILSKRLQGDEKSRNQNLVSRIVNLSPEISVKKISTDLIEHIDLEKELVATTIAKPSSFTVSTSVDNVTIVPHTSGSLKNVDLPANRSLENLVLEKIHKKPSSSIEVKDEESDPDYIPPKILKM